MNYITIRSVVSYIIFPKKHQILASLTSHQSVSRCMSALILSDTKLETKPLPIIYPPHSSVSR